MAKFPIAVNATSETIDVFIQDSSSTTGAGLTGLAFNSASLTCYYNVARGTSTSVTLATLASATAAWSSGGFKEIDSTNQKGKYRFDIPNALLASGNGRYVGVTLQGATNMAPCLLEIELTGWNSQDAVRGGMTALPNANAEASGGLYTRGSGAGQINQPANGQIDANTVKVGGTTQTARDLGASVLLSSGTGTGQISLSSGTVTVGTNNDKTGYSLTQTFPSNFSSLLISGGGAVTVGTNNDKTGYTASTVSDKTGYSLSSLESPILESGTAQAGAASTITLRSGASATDNLYRGLVLRIYGGTGAGQARVITGYVGSTKVATVDNSWITNPDVTSTYAIIGHEEAKLDSSQQVTVGTNNDKTGYSLSASFPANFSSLAITAGGAITVGTNNDKAGYSLSQTFPSNFSSLAITGGGAVTVGTNSDKTGYSLTQTFPTNFSSLAITGGGAVTIGTNGDKTGYSLAGPDSDVLESGTAQAGASGTITLRSGASATGSLYNGLAIRIYSGTGAGQGRVITAYNGGTKVATVDTNWITAPDNTSLYAVVGFELPKLDSSQQVSAGTVASVSGSVGSVVSPVTVGTNSDKTGYGLSSLESPILESGTAQAGAASTITLRSGASSTDNLYRGLMLRIYGGTGSGQARVITGYVGSTKVATLDNSWITNPDATSTYAITGQEAAKLDSSQRVSAGSVSDKTGYSLSALESPILESGTAQAGGASTITLRAGASATDSLYNGLMLRVYGGTGVGQARVITGYVGSTKIATVDNDWITMPDATSTYAIIGHEAPGIDATGSVKLQIPLKRNVSQPVFPFTMRDTNGNLASGLTVTTQVTIDGAAFVPATNTPTEIGSGYYFVNLDAADLNGTAIGLRFTAAGAQTKDIEVFTQP